MSLPQRCVIMLEDVDAAGITEDREQTQVIETLKSKHREKREKEPRPAGEKRVTLSGLLNAIGDYLQRGFYTLCPRHMAKVIN